MEAPGQTTCQLCGEEFDTPEGLAGHLAFVHEDDDEHVPWWAYVLSVPVLLWQARWGLAGLAFIVAIVLGVLGVFDKDPAPESPNCTGYKFVRELKAKGQINTFQSVEPETGWTCEYSLDNEDAMVRFKRVGGGELELYVEGRSTPTAAYAAASREARAEGYSEK